MCRQSGPDDEDLQWHRCRHTSVGGGEMLYFCQCKFKAARGRIFLISRKQRVRLQQRWCSAGDLPYLPTLNMSVGMNSCGKIPLKVDYEVLVEEIFTNSLCFHDLINWIYKLSLKDSTISYSYFVHVWRTLPPSWLQTTFWDLIFLWGQLVYSVMKNIYFWICIITSLIV